MKKNDAKKPALPDIPALKTAAQKAAAIAIETMRSANNAKVRFKAAKKNYKLAKKSAKQARKKSRKAQKALDDALANQKKIVRKSKKQKPANKAAKNPPPASKPAPSAKPQPAAKATPASQTEPKTVPAASPSDLIASS